MFYKGVFLLIALSISMYTSEPSRTSFSEDYLRVWERHKIYTLQLIEAMPEDKFGYRPTPEVRMFGELVIHIATTNQGFAGLTFKEGNQKLTPEQLNLEGKSKQELIEIVSRSFDIVTEAVQKISAKELKESVPWVSPLNPQTSRTKREVFHIIREHVAHARGAMTIYLRLNNVKPPDYID